jgi:ribosomal protein L14
MANSFGYGCTDSSAGPQESRVTQPVEHIEEAKARLVRNGCVIIKDESNPRGATSRGPVRRHLQPDDLRPARRKRSHAKHAQLGKIELSCLRQ